jgi:hypothetical protein
MKAGLWITVCFFICFSGCVSTIPIEDIDNHWWRESKTWVTQKGDDRWIEVTKVKSDTLYGHYSTSDSLISVPVSLIENVEREKQDEIKSLFSGLLAGAIAGFISFSLLLKLLL